MILLTGGSGLLGKHLAPLINNCIAPSHLEFDILNPKLDANIDFIIHCAGYTDVNKAEEEKRECYKLNVEGTKNIIKWSCEKTPILYISTDSVFDGKKGMYKESDIPNPCNFYSITKLLAEHCLRECDHIIRTSFKERPWKYDYAFIDQFSSCDYVDVIAKMISDLINNHSIVSLPKIIHIGTERKSSYELAQKTKQDVLPIHISDVNIPRPIDTSLDCSLYLNLLI